VTWERYVSDSEYVAKAVLPQMDDIVARAMKAGASPPLEYMGAGMTSVVFCTKTAAYKVARTLSPVNRHLLSEEMEWLQSARRVPFVRRHIAAVRMYFPALGVIVRDCARGKVGGWSQEGRLHEIHGQIEKHMIPVGWTAPEFKGDSYVMTSSGPKLVDASMPSRVGKNLLRYANELLDGRRAPWERPKDLAFEIRREIGQTLTHEEAAPTLERLAKSGMGDYRGRAIPRRRRR